MTIKRVLDKKRMTTTGDNAGRYHIKIRLTKTENKRTIQRYFITGIFATEAEFKKIIDNPGKDIALQDKQTKLSLIFEKAKDILKHSPFITFDDFEHQLTAKGSFKDPLGFMQVYVDELDEAGDIGNRDYYKSALGSWQAFADEYHNGKLSFVTVTPKVLMKFEKWHLDKGHSITTVGMYTRAMRTIFNLAASEKYKTIGKDLYPFGKGKYQIPTSKGRKLALDETGKDKLLGYATLNVIARKGVDFWKLSYFANGINMADLAHLKFRQMSAGVIIFDRVKTVRTQRSRTPIEVIMRDEITEVIKRWGKTEGQPNEYVFKILREGLTPQQIKERIKDFIKDINEGLKIACEDLKLPKVTTYWARHTYATITKNNGASTEFIQEALGHSDVATTKAYLDSFDMETKKKFSNLL